MAPAAAIDRKSAIGAYTNDTASLMSHEDKVCSIEEGKLADMIVLDKNLFEIAATEIGKTNVLRTVFNGSVIYDAKSDPTGEEAIEELYGVQLDLTGESGHACCQWHLLRLNQKEPGETK